MSWFYGILAIMGWSFALIVLIVFLIAPLRQVIPWRRGFDVEIAPTDEKQS